MVWGALKCVYLGVINKRAIANMENCRNEITFFFLLGLSLLPGRVFSIHKYMNRNKSTIRG